MTPFLICNGPLIIALAIVCIDLFRKATNQKSFIEKEKIRTRIYSWLKQNTSDTERQRSKTTREISTGCNMEESQVIKFCFHHPYIYNPDGKYKLWSIYRTND